MVGHSATFSAEQCDTERDELERRINALGKGGQRQLEISPTSSMPSVRVTSGEKGYSAAISTFKKEDRGNLRSNLKGDSTGDQPRSNQLQRHNECP